MTPRLTSNSRASLRSLGSPVPDWSLRDSIMSVKRATTADTSGEAGFSAKAACDEDLIAFYVTIALFGEIK